jgi:cutinase
VTPWSTRSGNRPRAWSSGRTQYKATITQRHSGEAPRTINHIKSTMPPVRPDTKIVLGGYSQGASVINIVAGFNRVNGRSHRQPST